MNRECVLNPLCHKRETSSCLSSSPLTIFLFIFSPQGWEYRGQPPRESGVPIRRGWQDRPTFYRCEFKHSQFALYNVYACMNYLQVLLVNMFISLLFPALVIVWGENLIWDVRLQSGKCDHGKWNPRTGVCHGQHRGRPVFVSCLYTFDTLKATLCDFDCNLWLWQTKLNDAREYVTQNSNFSEIRSYFTERMSSVFPPWCPMIAEDRQSSRWTSEENPEDIFSIKNDLILLKLLYFATY